MLALLTRPRRLLSTFLFSKLLDMSQSNIFQNLLTFLLIE